MVGSNGFDARKAHQFPTAHPEKCFRIFHIAIKEDSHKEADMRG